MKHYGDITKINGHEVPLVDIVTGGSPCQDLSVAGKRAGLQGERSGLFMEQIRIIKEMRDESARQLSMRRSDYDIRDIKPRFMVWENVPGAFSSNKGEDFRCVLEEICRVEDKTATVPMPEKEKWSSSGCIMGDGWSVAWRLHDAQFWGVPQRRKRISLVADFGGQSAPEILFERKGVSGDSEQSESKGEETTRTVGTGTDATSYNKKAGKRPLIQTKLSGTLGVSQDQTLITGFDAYNYAATGEKSITLRASRSDTEHLPSVCLNSWGVQSKHIPNATSTQPTVIQSTNGDIAGTLDASYYKGCGERQGIEREVICIGNGQLHDAQSPSVEVSKTLNCMDDTMKVITQVFDASRRHDYQQFEDDVCETVQAHYGTGGGNVPMVMEENMESIVRRLTPMECERLQGYPDGWTDIGEWIDSKGKKHKDADSPRYKALGNSIALPFWEWMAHRMVAQYDRPTTIASLFDGIGGFPLVFSRCGTTPVWASEIEEFPIAVTKKRFPDFEDETHDEHIIDK